MSRVRFLRFTIWAGEQDRAFTCERGSILSLQMEKSRSDFYLCKCLKFCYMICTFIYGCINSSSRAMGIIQTRRGKHSRHSSSSRLDVMRRGDRDEEDVRSRYTGGYDTGYRFDGRLCIRYAATDNMSAACSNANLLPCAADKPILSTIGNWIMSVSIYWCRTM